MVFWQVGISASPTRIDFGALLISAIEFLETKENITQ